MLSSVTNLVGITVTFNKLIEGTKLAWTNNVKLEIQLGKKNKILHLYKKNLLHNSF